MRPLLMSAWHGHKDAVQVLVNAGASTNSVNKVSICLENSIKDILPSMYSVLLNT